MLELASFFLNTKLQWKAAEMDGWPNKSIGGGEKNIVSNVWTRKKRFGYKKPK